MEKWNSKKIATQMESEPSLQCIKFTNNSQFPSTSIQDSSLIFANLTPTLIIEILSRIPVKSILQYNLSSSNKETTYHRLMMMFSRFTGILYIQCSFRSSVYDSVTETPDLNIPMIKNRHENLQILHSVNGLILVSIRKYKKLPSPSFETRLTYVSDYSYYFIYDEFHDDYKVVVTIFNFRHVS
ncbi:hypothetical protein H5410_036164 [Solanum commersonii]|uniref:F-box domain-containing protein n=1 Tax=Solanum commersonii TaxID=4109 RepID=A0A9J5Y6R6_SOLCO|nr:hypothetical protein H5410_036164 [Solanum commersonii]